MAVDHLHSLLCNNCDKTKKTDHSFEVGFRAVPATKPLPAKVRFVAFRQVSWLVDHFTHRPFPFRLHETVDYRFSSPLTVAGQRGTYTLFPILSP
jgi:hypothetical protein